MSDYGSRWTIKDNNLINFVLCCIWMISMNRFCALHYVGFSLAMCDGQVITLNSGMFPPEKIPSVIHQFSHWSVVHDHWKSHSLQVLYDRSKWEAKTTMWTPLMGTVPQILYNSSSLTLCRCLGNNSSTHPQKSQNVATNINEKFIIDVRLVPHNSLEKVLFWLA